MENVYYNHVSITVVLYNIEKQMLYGTMVIDTMFHINVAYNVVLITGVSYNVGVFNVI